MKKNVLILISLSYPFLASPFIACFLFYVVFSTIFPSSPNKTEAIKLTFTISGDYLPESFELVHSKQYMEVLSSNMCFVYRYPEGHYPAPKSKFNYLNQNSNLGNKDFSDFSFDFGDEVEPKEGCFKFISNLDNKDAELFVDYGFHYEYGRGSKIFINDRDNLIMFEGYIYD